MKRIFKLSIAALLTMTLGVATVVCCCIAPTVMAVFHKQIVCSHCPGDKSQGKSSSPATACQQQLTSAEFLHSSTIVSPVVSAKAFPVTHFLINHQLTLAPSILSAYPPGGPPLGISLTPLYLRTFNLRV